MKTKIKIEKIFKNKVKTKLGEKDKFVLISDNIGYSGWGECPYKEGEEVEIEYDENSKYEGKNNIYYDIVYKKKETEELYYLKTILDEIRDLKRIIEEENQNDTLFND
ncbi:MAG TPA: hypothetical protein PKV21_07710 [bacterium]|nr:hypothetical protein [bacterium]